MAIDLGTAYPSVQDRMLGAAEPSVDVSVPACPAWSVRDVIGHVAGLAKDAVDGTLPSFNLLDQWRDESVATQRDDMTDKHVVRARSMSFDDVVDEWRRTTKTLVPMLRG